jgi:hypothetical protein
MRRLAAPLVLLVTCLTALTAGPSAAQVPAPEADYGGFATGTVLHAGALQAGATRVAGVEVAQSNAAVESRGLTERVSELGRRISAGDPSHQSSGRGVGLELGLAVDQPEDNQVQLAGVAEAAAAPSTELAVEELAVPAAPVAYSSTVRGEARAAFRPDDCALGADLGYGLGFVEDLQLVDTGDAEGDRLGAPLVATDHDAPARAVSQSVSRTRLVPQTDAAGNVTGPHLGLTAETRQTIAPLTLLEGTPAEMTFEFLGEWVLRATATGLAGGARVHYGPGEVSPQTPILRVLDAAGAVTDILSFQDVFGPEGVSIGEVVVIGEDPRAIGGDSTSAPEVAGDGTTVSAAVDVLRIQLPPQSPEQFVTDLRVGHMEVSVHVPAGGIRCPDLPVSKTSDPIRVAPGEEFTYTIAVPAVPNPYECTLTGVRVVDTISVVEGDITTTVVSSDPPASSQDGAQLVWEDVGPIAPGEQRLLHIVVRVDEGSTAGLLRNTADVTANCPLQPADSTTQVDVPLTGRVVVDVPEVTADEPRVLDEPPTERALARTGVGEGLLVGCGAALLLAAALLRRAVSRATTG